MAKSTLLLALAAAFLSLAAISATGFHPANQHKPAPLPHSGQYSTHYAVKRKHTHPPPENEERDLRPPEPYPGFYALVDRCLQKLSEECGEKIFSGIFGIDDVAAVGEGCCVDLVAMGRRCHRKILKATMMLPDLSKRERKEIKRRDAKIWSHCVSVSDALKYSPPPFTN